MNPSDFAWRDVFASLVVVSVLAVILESALAQVFESRIYVRLFGRRKLKEWFAVAAAAGICWVYHIDAVGWFLGKKEPEEVGLAVTALTIAGGSKRVMAVWKNVREVEGQATGAQRELKEQTP